MLLASGRRCVKRGHVGAVHCEDKIGFFEIRETDAACTLPGDVDAVGSCGRYGALVGLLALMPITEPCWIKLETIVTT
jgi:hypothetical protein